MSLTTILAAPTGLHKMVGPNVSRILFMPNDSNANRRDDTPVNLSELSAKELRVFLGFDQPPLVRAAEWLCNKYRADGILDLSRCLIVLPTSRSVQRLLQLLVRTAGTCELNFTPPRLITTGDFPEHLYDVKQKLASDLCQQLAWTKALQSAEEFEIEHLFSGVTKSTFDQWQPFAKLISDLHRRLGTDVWSFTSVIREIQKRDKNFQEIARWKALESVQRRYYRLLDDAGLWDQQAARNVAVKRNLCSTDRQIILVGTADLNRATRLMLDQVRASVSVLVAAPNSLAGRFDEFGGLITGAWLDADIKFPCEQFRIVDTGEDQALAACYYLTKLQDQFSADQITIGVADHEVQPQVERSLLAIGIRHRNLKGQAIRDTSPVRLMSAIQDYLDQQNFNTYAVLVRHPDIFRWISNQIKSNQWLAMLDDFQSEGLPDRIEIESKLPFGDAQAASRKYLAQNLPEIGKRYASRIETLNRVFQFVSKLCSNVFGPSRPIADWTDPWCAVLNEVYGDRILTKTDFTDRQMIEACRGIYAALQEKREVPAEWGIETTASRAIQLAIEAASDRSVIAPPEPDAVEIAGWLDLPLDDAPVLVITGMNDENVPESENGNLFLPNKMCTTLGIVDNDRRYARDAYALTVITSVRQHTLLIAGRRNLQGEPKKPSRLLFADTNDLVAKRANAFFAFKGKSESRFWLANPETAPAEQQLPIPKPQNVPALDELSVTAFREFIKCPYRFYLSKILRLDTATDDWQELDGGAFGNLAHEVLEDFGCSDICNATSEKQIMEFLNDRLNDRVKQSFRGSRLPAVRIQVEQLRMRLERFAPLQAKRVQQGWQIVSVEENNKHSMLIDGIEFKINGTIDRVDIHQQSGQVAIWDYKTSDRGDSPNTAHRDRNGWKELQLPLYRHLAREISALVGRDLNSIQLGYVLLPKKLDDVRFLPLKCSEAELEQADDLVKEIVRRIRLGRFWPPERKPPKFSEAFAGICQDNVFERFEISVQPESDEVSA